MWYCLLDSCEVFDMLNNLIEHRPWQCWDELVYLSKYLTYHLALYTGFMNEQGFYTDSIHHEMNMVDLYGELVASEQYNEYVQHPWPRNMWDPMWDIVTSSKIQRNKCITIK